MPHHGRSPWTPDFDYLDAADQVAAALLAPDDPVALVGHSMGGKIAMVLALRHPELVERLCVVDVAPVAYDSAHEFDRLHRRDARPRPRHARPRAATPTRALREAVPDPVVRGFLLQNLRRTRTAPAGTGSPTSRSSATRLDVITGWPDDRLAGVAPYDGPVLWVRRRPVRLRRATSTPRRWRRCSRGSAG